MLEPIKGKRIKKKKKKRKPPPKGDAQTSLDTGTTKRQDDKRERCEKQIEFLRFQYDLLRRIVDGENEDGVVLTALDLERYGPSRLDDMWFWLHPCLEEGAPDAEDYTFGSWNVPHSTSSEQYVRDRAEWFYPLVKEELAAAEKTLEQLKGRRW
uniref:Uncharacterized protein n=1 Tax=viral metagenome TaxID=1070528 RepID=A0A6M3LW33_9ZZZZ